MICRRCYYSLILARLWLNKAICFVLYNSPLLGNTVFFVYNTIFNNVIRKVKGLTIFIWCRKTKKVRFQKTCYGHFLSFYLFQFFKSLFKSEAPPEIPSIDKKTWYLVQIKGKGIQELRFYRLLLAKVLNVIGRIKKRGPPQDRTGLAWHSCRTL